VPAVRAVNLPLTLFVFQTEEVFTFGAFAETVRFKISNAQIQILYSAFNFCHCFIKTKQFEQIFEFKVFLAALNNVLRKNSEQRNCNYGKGYNGEDCRRLYGPDK
jgi:hypothetical protein